NLFEVVPFVRERHADIGLVLMIAPDDLDRHIADLVVELIGGDAHRVDRPHAIAEAELAREIVEHADLDLVVRELRLRGARSEREDGGGEQTPNLVHFLTSQNGASGFTTPEVDTSAHDDDHDDHPNDKGR